MRPLAKRQSAATHAALSTALLATTALAVALPALAHHSRANFDLGREIEVEGVVTEYAWKNPHAFVVVESTTEDGATVEWTFEMNSTPVLRRFGTTADSLAPGDHVIAHGNPDRDADKHFAYTTFFLKDDGTEVWSWGMPADTDADTAPPAPAEVAGSSDFTGVWRIQFQPGFDVLGADQPDDVLVTDLPVNAAGQDLVDNFDPDMNPEWDCLPQSIPTLLGYPYPFEVSRGDDTLTFLYEVNHVERVIHLGATEVPADAERSPVGYSIGRFDDDGALVIETAHFAPVRWGLGEGVDSSEAKTTREVYRLVDDGMALEMDFVMEDPTYLAEPVERSFRYNLNAGYEIQDYFCDPETSRRHLTAGE